MEISKSVLYFNIFGMLGSGLRIITRYVLDPCFDALFPFNIFFTYISCATLTKAFLIISRY